MIEYMFVQFIIDNMYELWFPPLAIIFIYAVYCNEYNKMIKSEYPYQYLLESPKKYQFNKNILDKELDKEPLYIALDSFCEQNNIYKDGCIVSLSGGVDSMVTFAILLKLQTIHNFPLFTATIDYGLRKESNDESRFIIDYVEMYNIKPTIHYIEGISRKKEGSGSRNEFEEESRSMRFNTYKKIMSENNMNCGVMVAHHMDDIIENIFTNSMRGANIMDMEVMKSVNTIHGVKMFRPFLGFKKQTIYDFAHKYEVPYFKDTTPKWSRRGQMRFEIFPLLDRVFGLTWHDNLKEIGTQSNEWGSYIENYVVDPWYNEIVKEDNKIIIPIKNQPMVIYKTLIMKALHSVGQRMLKRTSMEKIMVAIIKAETNNKKLSLDGSRYAMINNNNIIINY